jgi:mannobiose 2-epimerase
MESKITAPQFQSELYQNILPFWMTYAPDAENGGFVGGITNTLTIKNTVPRTAVSCTRFLWTFSHAFLVTGEQRYLDIAHHAYKYLKKVFWDNQYGGLFWTVDLHGQPINPRKHSYAQAFGIYSLSEYFKATHLAESLDLANGLYALLEAHAHDQEFGGYIEGFSRDWSDLEDMRLGVDDLNCQKSMNTMLHLMEAYTNLATVSGDQGIKKQLLDIIRMFQDHIISPAGHFILFFNSNWAPLSDHISYGHDIEGSWLLVEAAEALGDSSLTKSVTSSALAMADGVLSKGIRADHGIIQEASPTEITNNILEWWPQAEAVVGFYNAYQLTGEQKYLTASQESWAFINDHLIDREFGGWFKRLLPDGSVNENSLKAGPWEGPYHEARMCFEMIKRLESQI